MQSLESIRNESDANVKKTEKAVSRVNHTFINSIEPSDVSVEMILWSEWEIADEAELDEMWSFVGSKKNQRWLWLAIDHATHTVLAFTFGERKDKVFRELQGTFRALRNNYVLH